jgi:hypothetical protein
MKTALEWPGSSCPDTLQLLLKAAPVLWSRVGWEGDLREGPFVVLLPFADCFEPVALLGKQDNNGATFCVTTWEPLIDRFETVFARAEDSFSL